MITLGKYHTLKIIEQSYYGIYLDAKNLGKALLKTQENYKLNDSIEVFLYENSNNDLIATTKENIPSVGEFAFLPYISSIKSGAFLDWGIEKDLFVPMAEQHRPFLHGKNYLVYIYLDKIHNRPTATSKINKLLNDFNQNTFNKNDEVNVIIANSTDFGYKAIINNSHWGTIYKNEVFKKLHFGQKIKAYIKNIRYDDKIDLCLSLTYKDLDKNSELIQNILKENNGFLPYHDKSSPEDIQNKFSLSKGAFKKAIGNLFKKKIISIKNNGIYLN